MVQEELFSLALGLVPPWMVDDVTFTAEEKRLDLTYQLSSGQSLCLPGLRCGVPSA